MCGIINNLRIQAKQEVFNELKNKFPKTLQPLVNNTTIEKWRAIKAIGLLIEDMEKRHLSTSQSEGTELSSSGSPTSPKFSKGEIITCQCGKKLSPTEVKCDECSNYL